MPRRMNFQWVAAALLLLASPCSALTHTKTKEVLAFEKHHLENEHSSELEGTLYQMLAAANTDTKPSSTTFYSLRKRWLYTLDSDTYTDKILCNSIYSKCGEDDVDDDLYAGYSLNTCKTCGYGTDQYGNKHDANTHCYTCDSGQQIAVIYTDCTGFCIDTADAATYAALGFPSMDDSDCVAYGSKYPLTCSSGSKKVSQAGQDIGISLGVTLAIALVVGVIKYMKDRDNKAKLTEGVDPNSVRMVNGKPVVVQVVQVNPSAGGVVEGEFAPVAPVQAEAAPTPIPDPVQDKVENNQV